MGLRQLIMNITLIGMPGSGKTSVGKELAGILDYELIDPDRLMEKIYACPLQAVLDKMGERRFLEKEEQTVVSATKGKNSLVISTGGSIVYCPKAMEHLRDISTIFYLRSSLAVIERRIGNGLRGIVGLQDKTIACLYSERAPLYERWSEVVIDADYDAKSVAAAIIEKLRSKHGAQRF